MQSAQRRSNDSGVVPNMGSSSSRPARLPERAWSCGCLSIAGSQDVLAPIEAKDEARAVRRWDARLRTTGFRPAATLRVTGVKRLVGRRPHFWNHMPAEAVRRYVGESVWKSFMKITVERDRYDRAVSMFRWQTRERPIPTPSNSSAVFPSISCRMPNLSIDGKVVADMVLDFAELEDDISALQRLMGVPPSPLPRSKVSAGGRLDSRTLLGPEGCSIVDRACQHDIALTLADKRPSG